MRKKIIIFSALSIIIILTMAITSLQQSNSLTPDEFYEKINVSGVQLIDIRTAEEYRTGHIENAVNIDFNSESFEESLLDFNPEKPIYIYCKTGNRSLNAVSVLEQKDFKFVYDLRGGIIAWKTSGYKIMVEHTNATNATSALFFILN